MTLSRLILTNFRNHPALDLDIDSDFIVFSGSNGIGKTNILEAVSMLAPGRGLRRASIRDMALQEANAGFSISAICNGTQMGVGVEASSPDKRIVRINGANAPINRLAQYMSMTWLTPAMDRIFSDGSSARRRFLDRLTLALFPDHALHSSRYENAMRERNRIFNDEMTFDEDWVDSLETLMAHHGFILARNRIHLIEALSDNLLSEGDSIFAKPDISLLDDGYADEEHLLSLLRQGRGLDRTAKRCLKGPHRDDLLVKHSVKGQDASKCSTGEQKALLLSIILAHANLVRSRSAGKPLVILLDEVAAHLDPARRLALFEKLSDSKSQIWLTGTERILFNGTENYALHHHLDDIV